MESVEQTLLHKENKSEFRELRPEEFWGGSVHVKGVNDQDFGKTMSETAMELDFTFSGYRTPKTAEEFEYHFSRYPRRKFGPVAPIEKYKDALTKLSTRLNSRAQQDQRTETQVFRIVLGLQEGYDKEAVVHTIEEVRQELGETTSLAPVEIYSVGTWGKYNEPAVVIECDQTNLAKVYVLAEKFHQARFAVEDLHNNQSHIVETKYCTDPDTE